jgi:hypothetical protein
VLASGCFYCSFYSMVESCWPTLVTMQEHVQNLVSQGCITVAKLATCHVPTDPGSPVLVGGYVVACSAFYEQGFGMPSHRFIHLLLQFYGLKLVSGHGAAIHGGNIAMAGTFSFQSCGCDGGE